MKTPPLGWNSFDSFGGYLHEAAAFAQLEAFARKLAPHGYDTFVVDIGWYGEYRLKPGTMLPVPESKHARTLNLDGHGRPLPSKCYFPHGFAALIDRCHGLGLRFGLHLMRGIPRQAVEGRLPIKGAPGRTAADIADPESTCPWCHYNYGVAMGRPGAQAYYDSLVELVAGWGVDFIKADDITGHPTEIDALADAIARASRPITLSLSHGGEADPALLPVYRRADLVRVTKDIWDDRVSIERTFLAWEFWGRHADGGFRPDLDMIPFGDLQTMSPEPLPGEWPSDRNPSLCGRGYRRRSHLDLVQRETFITQRALAASPLFYGGDLTTLAGDDLHLLTDPRMLACNRNGVCAAPIYLRDDVQVWRAPHRARAGAGWLGVFNRNPGVANESMILTPERLGLAPGTQLHDVWRDRRLGGLDARPRLELPPGGCVFLEYEEPGGEAQAT